MTLIDLSMAQALELWGELCDALHGVNKYGGNTAEVYAYRCGPTSPCAYAVSGEIQKNAKYADGMAHARALAELCEHFEIERHAMIVVLDTHDAAGKPRRIGRWFAAEPFTHRVHLRVAEASERRLDTPSLDEMADGADARW